MFACDASMACELSLLYPFGMNSSGNHYHFRGIRNEAKPPFFFRCPARYLPPRGGFIELEDYTLTNKPRQADLIPTMMLVVHSSLVCTRFVALKGTLPWPCYSVVFHSPHNSISNKTFCDFDVRWSITRR